MRSKLLRIVGVLLILGALGWLAGLLLPKLLGEGDEDSDDFRLFVLQGGREFRSRAGRLRRGSVLAMTSGVQEASKPFCQA